MNYLMLKTSTTLDLNNEIDFLTFVGTNTSSIIKYVKASKMLDNEVLAQRLGISLGEEQALESFHQPLPDCWRQKLREYFN